MWDSDARVIHTVGHINHLYFVIMHSCDSPEV